MAKFNWMAWALFGAVLGTIGGILVLLAFTTLGDFAMGLTGVAIGLGVGSAAIAVFAIIGALLWTFYGFLWDSYGFKQVKDLPAFQELFTILFSLQLISLFLTGMLNVSTGIIAGIVVLLELTLVFGAFMLFKWKLPVK